MTVTVFFLGPDLLDQDHLLRNETGPGRPGPLKKNAPFESFIDSVFNYSSVFDLVYQCNIVIVKIFVVGIVTMVF